eukprot:858146-Rhodomonas_salina.2
MYLIARPHVSGTPVLKAAMLWFCQELLSTDPIRVTIRTDCGFFVLLSLCTAAFATGLPYLPTRLLRAVRYRPRVP